MPPKRNKRQQERAKRSADKVEKKKLVRTFEEMELSGSSTAASQPTPSASEPQSSVSSDQAPTDTLISKYPLYEKWETMEEEERGRVRDAHRSQTGPFAFQPAYLPVQVHVAAPQQGRFTREIETDIIQCNTLEAVKDLVKSSLSHELLRTNIDPTRTKFAGLMIYGPATQFSVKSISSRTRGLFLDPDTYKKWWLDVVKSQSPHGEVVKTAVVLCDQEEAAAKQVELPDFWTNPTAGLLANYMEKMEPPIWERGQLEQANIIYVKMQERLQQQRCEAEETRSQLTQKMDNLVNAVQDGDMVKARRLAAQWKKATRGKGKEVDVDKDEEVSADEDDEDDEPKEADDPNDEDYDE
ncbi:hypothetical protein PV05_02685 [Exophiala xenobiotica]|uniref:Uncharacterized protein n=1 Tax=Exophiala xenobiotica TaxID=348802 RepID=A0A0D2ER14_9EURO|nr:uncharacterized protein PV05_02685 [Exophiala xenobiotica]KIW58138.1 hypothetical protein PV05_02685 [Exophiala xenobiotica]